MIALDSSVLVDILTEDRAHAAASEACIGEALQADDVVVCDAVVAEVQAMLDTPLDLMEILATLGVRFDSTAREIGRPCRADESQVYRSRGGKRQRVVADFLIGAHALLQCDSLITRDGGFFRDYFKGLKIIVPKTSR